MVPENDTQNLEASTREDFCCKGVIKIIILTKLLKNTRLWP